MAGTEDRKADERADDRTNDRADDEPGAAKRWLHKLDAYQRRRAWLAWPFAVMKKFGEDGAGNLAALIAYFGFFSMFPLLLLLFTILGFVLEGNPGLREDIVDSTLAQFPIIGDQIEQNVGSIEGSGVALAVGIVGALWAGMGALNAAQTAMNSVWDVPMRERPKFIEARLRALVMLAVLGAGVIAVTLVGSAAAFSDSLGPLTGVVGFILSSALGTGLFLLAFKVLTDRELGWGQLLAGAVVGGIGWAILQAIGGWYMGNQLKGASQTYGLFGLVLGLLSWIYLQAQVMVLAAEVNVVRERRLWPRSLSGDDLTDADHRALHEHARVEERVEAEKVDVDLNQASDDTGPDDAATDGSRRDEAQPGSATPRR